jgi:multicopper oxidase
MGRITFDFVADNPGDWLFHCHNVYHMESGMMRVVSYEV